MLTPAPPSALGESDWSWVGSIAKFAGDERVAILCPDERKARSDPPELSPRALGASDAVRLEFDVLSSYDRVVYGDEGVRVPVTSEIEAELTYEFTGPSDADVAVVGNSGLWAYVHYGFDTPIRIYSFAEPLFQRMPPRMIPNG